MNDEKNRTSSTTGTATLEAEHPEHEANRDPLSGEPGAHPVGTGVGAATGGTVGAVVGSVVGGPVGAMIGAAVGGLAGGLAGKGIAESVNPSEEDAFWRDNYSNRSYAQDRPYDEYRPAYQYGWESRARYEDRSWNDVERDLETGWNQTKGTSNLGWSEARHATRDAWDRLDDRFRANRSGEGTAPVSGSYGAAAMSSGTENRGGTGTGDFTGAAGNLSSSSLGSSTTGSTWSSDEDNYWRQSYATRPYVQSGRSYDDYRPAYQYGWDSANRYQGRTWEDTENDLERGWEHFKGTTRMTWIEVKDAVRDSWNRVVHGTTHPETTYRR